MRFWTIAGFLLILFVVVPGPATAAIYYVSPHDCVSSGGVYPVYNCVSGFSPGNDTTGTGTAAKPFASPQKAINAAINPGDIVAIMSGLYLGTGAAATMVLSHSGSGPGTVAGGSCTKPITVEGYAKNPSKPIIFGNYGAIGAGGVFATNVSCIVVSNLEIEGWNFPPFITWQGAIGNAVNSYWQSNTYTDYGVFFVGTTSAAVHHIVLSNLYVHDFPGGGIGFVYGDYLSVLQNAVINNAEYSPYEGSGISLYENKNIDSSTDTHNVVSGNLSTGNVNLVPGRNVSTNLVSTPILGTRIDPQTGVFEIEVGTTTIFNYTQLVMDYPKGCIPPGTTFGYAVNGGVGEQLIAINQAPTPGCTIDSSETLYAGFATDGEGIIIDNTSNSQTTAAGGIAYLARTLVINNVTTSNGGAGIQCGPQSSNCDIIFNTSYMDQAGAYNYGSSEAPGGINAWSATSTNIFNNIIVAGPNVPSVWDQSGPGAVVWSNNLFFGGVSNSNPIYHPIPGSNNVVGQDPLFMAPTASPTAQGFPSATMFQPGPGSPAIGAGSSRFTRSTDFTGASVPTGTPPDIGAYH
jgi:hypothetical protein